MDLFWEAHKKLRFFFSRISRLKIHYCSTKYFLMAPRIFFYISAFFLVTSSFRHYYDHKGFVSCEQKKFHSSIRQKLCTSQSRGIYSRIAVREIIKFNKLNFNSKSSTKLSIKMTKCDLPVWLWGQFLVFFGLSDHMWDPLGTFNNQWVRKTPHGASLCSIVYWNIEFFIILSLQQTA